MKDFLTKVLAVLVALGIVFGGALFCLLLIFALFQPRDTVADIKPDSILRLKLNYDIPERTLPFNIGFDLFTGGIERTEEIGLNHIVEALDNAREDDRIKGVFLDLDSCPSGMATLDVVRRALQEFKKDSGKFIFAHGNTMSQKAYYLASVSDEIYLHPKGELDFRGLSTQVQFYKTAMDKLGIEAQIFYAGKFKSATEPFRATEMSEANREQISEYLNDAWQHYREGIATQRKLSAEELHTIADEAKVQTPADAKKLKMIDDTLYLDQVLEKLAEKTNRKAIDKINFIRLAKYVRQMKEKTDEGSDRIAVIYATGIIVDGEGSEDSIGGDRFAKIVRKLRLDKKVKGVVLRVNSGGGSALASDTISRELQLLKKAKPLAVSFGDVAASGGYYIGAHSHKIFAEKISLTGSIGVFGIIPNLEDFLENRIGITSDEVKTTQFANLSITRKLNEAESRIFQNGVDRVYSDFKAIVADGRSFKPEAVESIAQGRVYTGLGAKKLKLIDEFGGLQEAIEFVAKEAKVEKYGISDYPKTADPFDNFLGLLLGEDDERYTKALRKELGVFYKDYRRVKNLLDQNPYQMTIPFDIELN